MEHPHHKAPCLIAHVLAENKVLTEGSWLSRGAISDDALEDGERSRVLIGEHAFAELSCLLEVCEASHLENEQVKALHAGQVNVASAVRPSKTIAVSFLCRLKVELCAEVDKLFELEV